MRGGDGLFRQRRGRHTMTIEMAGNISLASCLVGTNR